ncbi:hypothetical protein HHK36_026520 [Tetracentron sinense]|uniref:Uncharacterized protein n=1 Tax=Tetracentron sinense TaxID=13715 RepID=A0A835D297_TETSI|nr:hypothetical protein HHK36_026520 [Tetracentron sinense]
MTRKTLNSRHAVETCAFQLHSWRPFQVTTITKTLESDLFNSIPCSPTSTTISNGTQSKRPCLSDRATSFSIDSLEMSKLSLFEDERTPLAPQKRENFRWIARKRRRRGSRSVSGRSSERSGTRRCCSVGASAAYATCSDFPVAVGTDSSGELFLNGDANWASDVSEAKNSRRERRDGGGGERENLGFGSSQNGLVDSQGTESGYGSEPGYRGDAEFGYGDELDDEENDGRLLFWGERLGAMQLVIWRWLGRTHSRSKKLITGAGVKNTVDMPRHETLYVYLVAESAMQARWLAMESLSMIPNNSEAAITAVYVDLLLGKPKKLLPS